MNYNKLTNEEKLVVNSEVSSAGKNLIVAFILDLFLGTLGIHRLYVGKKGSGIAMMVLTFIGWLTAVLFIGFVPLIITGIWSFVDLFLVTGMVEEANNNLKEEKAIRILSNR